MSSTTQAFAFSLAATLIVHHASSFRAPVTAALSVPAVRSRCAEVITEIGPFTRSIASDYLGRAGPVTVSAP